MFLLSKTMIPIALILLAIVFAGFYVWRRIVGLNCHIQVLEKKLTNLKKENKDLHTVLSDNKTQTTTEQADIVMNKIFNQDDIINVQSQDALKKPSASKKVAVDCSASKCSITEIKDVRDLKDINENVVENQPLVLPVANHGDIIQDIIEKDIELESVISDTSNIYNRKKLNKMNIEKLKEICTTMNISSEGNKNSLIDRILAQ